MKGLFIDTTEPPQFLFQKFSGTNPAIVSAAIEAMVDTMGFATVFGRVFKWVVDDAAKVVIKEDAGQILQEHGYDLDHETAERALIYGTLRVTMCHEAYVIEGDADEDAERYGLQHEVKHMVGVGRMHEDDLATLISPGGCLVTTRAGLMTAMYGMKVKRVDTGHSHELVIFYDDEFSPPDDSKDSGDEGPDWNLSDVNLDL